MQVTVRQLNSVLTLVKTDTKNFSMDIDLLPHLEALIQEALCNGGEIETDTVLGESISRLSDVQEFRMKHNFYKQRRG